MNIKITCICKLVICLLCTSKGFSQDFITRDSITKKGVNLIFINKDSLFSAETKEKLIRAFYKVYPAEVKRFHRSATKKVVFIIDPEYKGVAATSNDIVRYSPKWLKDHPEDIDVVTHEVMHIVQAYGRGAGPGWLTEGIADYVRYKYGVNNVAGKWTLPDYKEGQSYTNAYRITARFFVWLEGQGYKKLVDNLDAAMRSHTYTPEIWKELTGKTVDELWKDYTKNPAVGLSYK